MRAAVCLWPAEAVPRFRMAHRRPPPPPLSRHQAARLLSHPARHLPHLLRASASGRSSAAALRLPGHRRPHPRLVPAAVRGVQPHTWPLQHLRRPPALARSWGLAATAAPLAAPAQALAVSSAGRSNSHRQHRAGGGRGAPAAAAGAGGEAASAAPAGGRGLDAGPVCAGGGGAGRGKACGGGCRGGQTPTAAPVSACTEAPKPSVMLCCLQAGF